MRNCRFLSAWLPLLLYAQGSLPDTPAATRFGEWLKVFNDGDRSQIQQYFEENFPARAAMIDQTMAVRQQTGGFDLEEIEEAKPGEITCLLRTRARGMEVRASLEVEPQEPHRIASLRLAPAGAVRRQSTPAGRMSEADAVSALRAELNRRAAADQFSGAVLVAKNGRAIFEQAYGLANRERKTPNRLDTQFRLGSMNKMFTGTAIVQLAQAGKLSFNDPLGKYLPDYPNRDVATRVTIHNLLTHTGGTGDFFGPEYQAHREELHDLKDYVALFGKRGLEFEPGSRWEYSNYGFLLLGLLVEAVSGESYYDYVREHIYKVAGMPSSDSLPENTPVPRRSVGYTRMGGAALHPNTDTLPPRPTSAGGGYSTVGDLLAFANSLVGHKLLDAHYTDTLTGGKVDTGRGGKYAYGFEDHNDGGVRWFGHGGGAPGMNGVLRIYPHSGYAVAVLANLDPPAAEQVATFVADRLPAK